MHFSISSLEYSTRLSRRSCEFLANPLTIVWISNPFGDSTSPFPNGLHRARLALGSLDGGAAFSTATDVR